MADKFGAAMALVKSDIGGNISVGFCHPFLSYIFLFLVYMDYCMHAYMGVHSFVYFMCDRLA